MIHPGCSAKHGALEHAAGDGVLDRPAIGVGAPVRSWSDVIARRRTRGIATLSRRAAASTLPPVVGLANLAGISSPTEFAAVTPAEWDRVFAVNMRGTYLVTHAVLLGMVARGVDRIGTPAEVAALMAFLMGPDAGYITAATYDINGGLQVS